MSTFLWESIAFGPIHSRRLGHSLGINLLPLDVKICSFNCLYCECGWTLEKSLTARAYYPVEEVLQAIEYKLIRCRDNHVPVDSITFSGNGGLPSIRISTKSLIYSFPCATNTIPMP